MKESIAAIKWVLQGLMIAAMVGAGWLAYKFVTEPGYLAELALGVDADEMPGWNTPDSRLTAAESAPGDSVVTSRLPQASGLPQAGTTASQHRLQTGASGGTTTSAGTYTPRTSATGGTRTVSRKKQEPAPAYTPPLAQRKVIRVGD